MFLRRGMMCGAVLALLAAGLTAAETTVPVNGDFENGMTGWTRRGRGPDAPGKISDFMTFSDDAARGGKSLRLHDPWTECSPYGTLELAPLPYAEEYLVRCRVKAPEGQPFSLGAQYLSPTKYLGASSKRFTGTGKWEACEFRIHDVPSECSTLLAVFHPTAGRGFAATGTMLIDDVSVVRRPAPDARKKNVYYISPAGSDRYAGTLEFPWQSIDRLNDVLKPGDTAVFLPGRYNGCISPRRSGRAGAPITYRAQTPGTVFLCGGASFDGIAAIAMKDRSHIVVSGFSARNTWNSRWLRLVDVTDSEFSQLHFSGTDLANALRCQGVKRCRFRGIFAERSFSLRSGQVAYDMWNNENCEQNVYEQLYIRKAGHRPFGMGSGCAKNVVRDAVFDCRFGRNFEMFNVRELLMERCVLTNAYEGSGSADPRAKIFSFDSIFRRNVVFRNAGIPIGSTSYRYKGFDPPFGITGMRFYHNTLAFNDEAGWVLSDLKDEQINADNRFQNNIFAHNDRFGAGAGVWNRNVRPGNPMIRNLFYGRKPNDTVILLDDRWLTVAEAEKAFADRFSGNLDADPRFAAPEKLDFSLRPDSPALNSGAPAAVLTADADGAVVQVSDAAMFYDGYGIPGETGDEITVAGRSAVVKKVDRKRNTLTLDRAVKAPKGGEIQFAWAVGKPDLGAFETGRDAANPKIPAECYVAGFDEPHGVYTADFEWMTSENWFYFFHYATFARSFARIDDRDLARRCLMIYATDVAGGRGEVPSEARPLKPGEPGSRLAVSIRPPHWDIDVYPIMKFDYRVLPGIRWNMIVFPYYAPDRRHFWITLGSTDNEAEDWMPNLKLFELVADGKWHTQTVNFREVRKHLPGVRGFRRVDWGSPITRQFQGLAAPGSRAWIDNFQLIPASVR